MMTELEPTKRILPCWISAFEEWTADAAAPPLFKKWAAISAIAGSLGRRVWVRTNAGKIYPNMFVLLVGPPGTGKDQALNPARDLIARAGMVPLAPMSMTHKGLVDELAEPAARKQFVLEGGAGFESYHTLYVSVPELGVLLPSHDLGFLSTLNDLFNCGPVYEERQRSKGERLRIDNPHLHIVAGTQPKYLGELFPEQAYGMGFTSRVIMIYEGETHKPDLWGKSAGFNPSLEEHLVRDLRSLDDLAGEFHVELEAQEAISHWFHHESDNDRPTHSKLMHYNARRILHIFKLCMALSVSKDSSLIITEEHFREAHATLLEAERAMTEIFKEITTGGAGAEIEDAFNFMVQVYSKTKKPVPEFRLIQFLSTRIPANQITYVINTMLASKMIEDASAIKSDYPGKERLFKPRALNAFE